MTTDSPKGPERGARPEESAFELLEQTYELAERQYAEQTAELKADRDRYKAALESTQRALIRMETQRDELRHAIVRAAGGDPDLSSDVDTDHLGLVSRLREQLAAQTEQVERTRRAERRSIASVLTGMLEELEAAYVGEFGEGPAPSRDRLRAVQKFSVDLFATSGPVELDEFEAGRGVSSSEVEAPQPQRVFVGAHSLKETCRFCDAPGAVASDTATDRYHFVGVEAPSEAPEPDEFAMTLRPQLQANSKLEQNLDEGRPSGSERLEPRSGLAPGDPVRWNGDTGWFEGQIVQRTSDEVVRSAGCFPATDKWWDVAVTNLGTFYADKERQLGSVVHITEERMERIVRDKVAAQAARSEATPRGPSRCIVCGKSADKHATPQWCMSDQFVDGSWPSPSLRKEGEDRDAHA